MMRPGIAKAAGSAPVAYADFVAGNWTLSSDSAGTGTYTTNDGANGGGYASGITMVGDCSVKGTFGAATKNPSVGLFPTSELATWSPTDGDGYGGFDSMTDSFWICRGGASAAGVYKGNASQNATAWAPGDTFEIVRTGTALAFKKNGSTVYTASGVTTADMYVAVAHDNGSVADLSALQYIA